MKRNISALVLLVMCLSTGSRLNAMDASYDGNRYKNAIPQANDKKLKDLQEAEKETPTIHQEVQEEIKRRNENKKRKGEERKQINKGVLDYFQKNSQKNN